MNELLNNIEGIDGMQAVYGGGDYTVTVWENMDGGYDMVFHRSNSAIAFNRIDGLSAEETVAKMEEYEADPSKWYAVEYES